MNNETWIPEILTWDTASRAFDPDVKRIVGYVFFQEKDDPNSTVGNPLPSIAMYGGKCGGINTESVYATNEEARRWVEWNYYRAKERLRCINECYLRISELKTAEECVNNLSELHTSVYQLERINEAIDAPTNAG